MTTNSKKKNALDMITGKGAERKEGAQSAPQLTPEKEEEYRTLQAEARNRHRGRPQKWEKDERGNSIRGDGYKRTSMIVNVELWAKMKEIAFRSGATEKEVLEQAISLAVKRYEDKNGVVIPNPAAYTAKKDIFK